MESSGLCCVFVCRHIISFAWFHFVWFVANRRHQPIAHGHFNIDISDNIFQLSCFFIVGPISLASSSFFPLCYNFSRCSSSSSRWYTTSICWFSRPTTILPIPHTSSTREKEMGGQNKYRDFSNVFFFIDARRDTVNIFRILCIQCVGGCKPIVSVLACKESWQATRAGWRRIRGKTFSLRRRQRLDEGRLGASTESSMIKALEVIFLSTWNRVWRIIKGGKKSSVFV